MTAKLSFRFTWRQGSFLLKRGNSSSKARFFLLQFGASKMLSLLSQVQKMREVNLKVSSHESPRLYIATFSTIHLGTHTATSNLLGLFHAACSSHSLHYHSASLKLRN